MADIKRKVSVVSMFIYTVISLLATAAFLIAAKMIGGYPQVHVYAGAGWVFLLSMIVTMPLVTSRIKRRMAPGP